MRHRRTREVFIELTSLLDIVMILIFAVMIENSKMMDVSRDELDAALNKVEELTVQLDEREKELSELQKKYDDISLEYEFLKAENNDLKEANELLDTKIAELEAKIKELEKKLELVHGDEIFEQLEHAEWTLEKYNYLREKGVIGDTVACISFGVTGENKTYSDHRLSYRTLTDTEWRDEVKAPTVSDMEGLKAVIRQMVIYIDTQVQETIKTGDGALSITIIAEFDRKGVSYKVAEAFDEAIQSIIDKYGKDAVLYFERTVEG